MQQPVFDTYGNMIDIPTEEPEEEKEDTLILELSIEEALNLSTILDNARSDCTYLGITGNFNEQFAARLLNSAIDPIISQLEEGLEFLGAR